MVTIITTVTKISAVVTPPKMLIRGCNWLELDPLDEALSCCSGEVDSGLSSPCSLRVLSAKKGGKMLELLHSGVKAKKIAKYNKGEILNLFCLGPNSPTH